MAVVAEADCVVAVHVCALWLQLDDVMDRVRWFAEECDHLQGIQLITDATNVTKLSHLTAVTPSTTDWRQHTHRCVSVSAVLCVQAWAGVTDAVVKELRDEYGRTPVRAERMPSIHSHTLSTDI